MAANCGGYEIQSREKESINNKWNFLGRPAAVCYWTASAQSMLVLAAITRFFFVFLRKK